MTHALPSFEIKKMIDLKPENDTQIMYFMNLKRHFVSSCFFSQKKKKSLNINIA